ncbi:MAG: homoserine O-acetyltransferase [Acidobacteriota bacterium]|nr:homoserine O-acetyltransferase [Acidobacteriota bacterium]
MTAHKYRQIYTHEAPFHLTLGGILPGIETAYETWGQLAVDKGNVVLLFTGLSSSAHAASHNRQDKPGWWEAMIGPGLALDTDKYFVICFNYLGSCFGSTGPSHLNPATDKPYGPDFPPVLLQDLAESCKLVVDHLGIERVFCSMGASMGGMVALEYAARFADAVENTIMISATGRPGAQSIAYRYVQRQVILADPAYADGWYYDREEKPVRSMSVARQIGNITYRSGREFNERFGRTRADIGYNFGPEFQVESYLAHMGDKLAADYDANSFLFLSKAMDHYSLGYGFNTYEAGVKRIQARTLIIGVDTDILFPFEEQEAVYKLLRKLGKDTHLAKLRSNAGHDAFLVEVDWFDHKIRTFLDEAPRG